VRERPIFYVLNDAGEPVGVDGVLEWAQWFETAERTVAYDEIGESSVSTVFLGLDPLFGFDERAAPVLWETMIFGAELHRERRRYATRDEALKGHELAVAELRRAHGER